MENYDDLAVKALSQNIKRAVDIALSTAHFDITLQGIITEVIENENKYKVKINGAIYEIASDLFFKKNDVVQVMIPQNNPSNMFIYPYKTSECQREHIHTQSTAKTIWMITHNLNKYPNVIIMDNNGTQILVPVTYLDVNHVKITFSTATSGKAILR